jgi:hypothetical protein
MNEFQSTYRRPKKGTVQLTSLLDLLFVMIFLSLIQQKDIPKEVKKEITKSKTTTQKPTIKQINFPVTAIFNFYGTKDNPAVPNGSYMMQGNYNSKSGDLKLGGTSWLERPANYDMVPLSGIINDAKSAFTGRIEFQGCRLFTLKKVSSLGTTPISGKWEGEYDCSQGLTGLTLTIE